MNWNRWTVAAGVALVIAAGILIVRWLSQYARRAHRVRLREIDQIVNQDRVPEGWIRPYLQQIARLQAMAGTDAQIARLTEIARKRCLANIRELIRHAERMSVTRSEAGKERLQASLREHAAQWRAEAWEDQIAAEVERWQREERGAQRDE